MSSWIINPLGIIIAQCFGFANTPVIVLVLLAMGASFPFQLLLNECLASAENRKSSKASIFQLILILAMQVTACTYAVLGLSGQKFALDHAFLVIVLLAANTILSYRISIIYYSLVIKNNVSIKESVIVGVIPGLASLFLYTLFSIASNGLHAEASLFVIATTIVPTCIQWLYVINMRSSIPLINKEKDKSLPAISTNWLLCVVVCLAFLSAISTFLREAIATLSTNYIALFLVALNSLLSLINTITRADFLSRGTLSLQPILGLMVLISIFLFIGSYIFNFSYSEIIALIGVQAAIAFVIERARILPSR